MKKLNKKGFTLAELLIVVAIIAVLTAIAVPLFVGALNNAEESVEQANIRAVRAAAVSAILGVESSEDKFNNIYTDGKLQGPWAFTATVSKSGEVTNLKLADKGTGVASLTESYDRSTGRVLVKITLQDLSYESLLS